MRGLQVAAALHEARDQRVGDAEGWVGDDVERAPRQPEVGCIGFDDDDVVPEVPAQMCCAPGMELDRDDPSAGLDQRARERAPSRTDVDDEVAGPDTGVSDELLRPAGIELMPSPCPAWRGRGHGDGRSSRLPSTQPSTALALDRLSFRGP
ncbi:MAG TPA: hypothetical protein VK461_11045 [Acidimicrobiales bacterium]|nr:hypothetical protein [Acidimicrobiales bacterium]